MKIRHAVTTAALGACIVLPGHAAADFTGCTILIDEIGLKQGACPGDIIRTHVGAVFMSSLTDVNTGGAGGVSVSQTVFDSEFDSNFTVRTGSFYSADNSGVHITSGDFDSSLDIEQRVLLEDALNNEQTNNLFESFVRFRHRTGTADENGNTAMTAFNNIMNGPGSGPGADGSRYAPDARFLELNNEGRFLDLSSPDSRLHFRMQSAEWVDPDMDDARYIRFGQNRTDGDHLHFVAWSELTVGGVVVDSGFTIDPAEANPADRHGGLRDSSGWIDYTQSAGYGDDWDLYDFRTADFFHNTNYMLADGDGGFLGTPGTGTTPPANTDGLAYGEEVNNPNYAGPWASGSSHMAP